MSEFRYPVDTDQFAMIREKGLVYVDKTDLMFDLVNRYNYVFFARPRIPREIHHERLAHNAQPAGYYREVCIDRLYFNEDGTIKSVEPTL